MQAEVIAKEVRVGDVEPGQFVTIRARMVEQVGPAQHDRIAPRFALIGKSFSEGYGLVVTAHPDIRCTVEVIAADKP